jgi:glyoxylase I family protein
MNFECEHFGLAADDPMALRDWYVHVLGAETVLQLADEPPAFLIRLPAGVLIEIYQADFSLGETADNKLRGWRHLALRVEDLEAAKTDLEVRGVTFHENAKPAGGGGRVLFFRDLEGNLFHLVERPTGFSAS